MPRCCISAGRGRVDDSTKSNDYDGSFGERKRISLELFKSSRVIPRTARLSKLGKLRKSAGVLTTNLNSFESTSVRWKGVEVGYLEGSRSD